MAYFRKLPSGLWQATIRGSDGRKHTKTDPLKKVVRDWANDEESKVAQGRWRDPRRGRQPVSAWVGDWFGARVVEAETRRGDEGVLRNHILPHWADWKLADITALDVQQWVRRLEKDGRGPQVIRRAYNLFTVMLNDAVTAGVLAESPCRNIDRPATPPKLPSWFTREQVDRIRARLDVKHRGHSVMTELMCVVGLRWGEAAAVGGDRNPVDWLRGRIRIVGALSQHGRWKSHPKTSKSRREVPVPRYVLDQMSALLVGRDQDAYVFVSPRGRPLNGANWRKVWYAAIDAENATTKDPVPRLDPHDCRHTAASWLVQDGVPLYDVQALLGHESAQTTQRYAHLDPDRHARITESWSRLLAHQRRMASPGGSSSTG